VIPHLLRIPLLYAFTAGLTALFLFFAFGKGSNTHVSRHPGDAPQVVVVELFTSEGCSSCPPADTLLKELSEQQPFPGVQIVALEEHVDYWNNLGWMDPFSSNQFSQRQNDYAEAFRRDGVYTPQMIVDGQSEFIGSRSLSAREAIQKAADQPKLAMDLRLDGNSKADKSALEIELHNPKAISLRDGLELWVAITEKGLQSDVKAGENSGETLKHAAVVRSLHKADTLHEATDYKKQIELTLDPKWKKENLAVVAFIAEKDTRKIVGVATASLNSAAVTK
jgi:hypothetical protein